jgi:hypothetical protein
MSGRLSEARVERVDRPEDAGPEVVRNARIFGSPLPTNGQFTEKL